MKIVNHLLCTDDGTPVTQHPSPHHGRSIRKHEYLVMHYTTGALMQSTINHFTNPNTSHPASAHILIGRDGSIVQFVPFNIIAWHAGPSSWANRTDLNKFSIGIELDNYGFVFRLEDGKWGRPNKEPRFTDEQIIEAKHKKENRTIGWEKYPQAQMDFALEVAKLLFEKYNLIDVVGHDDICERKVDPGPAFAMPSFREQIFEKKPSQMKIKTKIDLDIREGPGVDCDILSDSPVPRNTPLSILNYQDDWIFVEVQKPVNNVEGLRGWVHRNFVSNIRSRFLPR